MNVNRLDHLVLTVASTEETVDFYTRVLGMEAIIFTTGGRRHGRRHVTQPQSSLTETGQGAAG
jgi:catechol 2,3-dioxygenase-like lactoylglutathione lyase family enzyme